VLDQRLHIGQYRPGLLDERPASQVIRVARHEPRWNSYRESLSTLLQTPAVVETAGMGELR